MNSLYITITFFLIHIGLGRKISIPYAIALDADAYNVLVFALVLDIVQIPVFEYLFSHTTKIALIRKVKERIENKSHGMEDSKMMRWAKRFGKLGTIVLAAMPFQGGGMWSGVLLATILKVKGWQMYLLLFIGSLIGCSIMAFGTSAVLSMF